MPKRLPNRSKALTEEEKEHFFAECTKGDLIYRYTMLKAHLDETPKTAHPPFWAAVCAYEASLLACRVFIEFLGLHVKHDGQGRPELVERQDYFAPDGK